MGLAVPLTPYPSCVPRPAFLRVGIHHRDFVKVTLVGDGQGVVWWCFPWVGVMMSLDHSAKMDRGGVWRSPGCWKGVSVKHRHRGLFSSPFSPRLCSAVKWPNGGISLRRTILSPTARVLLNPTFAVHMICGQCPPIKHMKLGPLEAGKWTVAVRVRHENLTLLPVAFKTEPSPPEASPRLPPRNGPFSPALEDRYCVTIIAGVMKDRARVG